MQEQGFERHVFYANEISVTAGPQDSTLAFRWITPRFDENRQQIGIQVEKEMVISLTSSLMRANAESVITLFAEMEKQMKNDTPTSVPAES